MINAIFAIFDDGRILGMICAAIAAAATVITLAMPLLGSDQFEKRMAGVAAEREKIRQRERERLSRGDKALLLGTSPKQYMQIVVERFKLSDWIGEETQRTMLIQAGYRGQSPYVVFLFFRMVAPLAMLVGSAFYVFFVLHLDYPWTVKLGICIAGAYLGIYLPNLLVKNRIARRQATINRAFPDALDLMLICVESGMALEGAFKRVSDEIGQQSIELAEELALTTAELSYLPDRRQAFDNFAKKGPARRGEIAVHGAAAERAVRHPYGDHAASDRPGKSRPAHDGSRKKGCGPASPANSADDPVLPAGAIHRAPGTGRYQGPRPVQMNDGGAQAHEFVCCLTPLSGPAS